MLSGDESDAEPISTEILADIHGSSQSCLIINRREACYTILIHIKQIQAEWKIVLLSTKKMG